ncbi:MAG: cyclic nucleotide-binding domain-containing protein [Hyphomicrobiales bacterium]|nr:cyclic nucleotide-binding domain-containing protein [Hyphomicrobiales bacterium]MCP4998090.1 cyclic nucleotide-binding domain-containing protein [Hyphomicrobiales bacterium]
MESIITAALAPESIAGHLSYGLLVLSMLMSSIVWLRAIALVSGVAGVVYSGMVLHDPIGTGWEALFVLANLGQLCLLMWRSRRVRFTDEEFLFCQNALVLVPPFLARQFIDAGNWRDVPAGTVLTQQDETVEQLTYVAEGHVDVTVNGRLVAACATGDFIGELGIISGRPATATTTATTDLRALVFERETLLKHLQRQPDIKIALQAGFKNNLRHKLAKANERTLAET